MNAAVQNGDEAVGDSNISYYNNIAGEYENLLDKEPANAVIRELVASKFTGLVKQGSVLDFGGGTGMDLNWLVNQGYEITVCEPSTAMRAISIQRCRNHFPDARIRFLNDKEADFRNWSSTSPFEKKVSGVLCNFAVINCIPDIDLLFEKLSLVIQPGGIIVMLSLDSSFKKRLRSNLKGTIYSLFSGSPVNIYVDYKKRRQSVYLHSERSIRIASEKYFDCVSYEPLRVYGFSLIHLVKK